MAKKRISNKQRFRIPTPPGVSLTRYFIGKLFGSIEYWFRILVGLALMTAVWRASAADLPVIVGTLVKALEESAIVAWIITVCVLLSSIAMIVFIIWRYRRELDRVTRERDKWQEELMQRKVRSSELR